MTKPLHVSVRDRVYEGIVNKKSPSKTLSERVEDLLVMGLEAETKLHNGAVVYIDVNPSDVSFSRPEEAYA